MKIDAAIATILFAIARRGSQARRETLLVARSVMPGPQFSLILAVVRSFSAPSAFPGIGTGCLTGIAYSSGVGFYVNIEHQPGRIALIAFRPGLLFLQTGN